MKRQVASLLALILVLWFPAGDSHTGRELGDRSSVPALEPFIAKDPTPVAASPSPAASPHLPVHLRIPSLDIDGPVRPVGMSDATTMEVPEDISVIGWFDRSSTPIAESGHTVVVGHRDGATDPNGVFRRLGDIQEGSAITIRDGTGRRIDYQVTHVDVLHDEVFAQTAPEIFRKDGPHRLVLLTCGGSYDADKGGYQANVVVMAERT